MYGNATAVKVDNYWNFLKNLTGTEKVQLITRLSSSLLETPAKISKKASDFYGVWKDEDFSVDALRMADEIKQSRKFRDSVEAF